jgi:hypothetical protein
MEGFGHGEARCSDGDARMVQLVRCAVASTRDGVIPAMCSDGGVRTLARLHGWRTVYDMQALARQRVRLSRAMAWAWSMGCCVGELRRGGVDTDEGERTERRERAWGRKRGREFGHFYRAREKRNGVSVFNRPSVAFINRGINGEKTDDLNSINAWTTRVLRILAQGLGVALGVLGGSSPGGARGVPTSGASMGLGRAH